MSRRSLLSKHFHHDHDIWRPPGAGRPRHRNDLNPETTEPETTDMTESLVWADDHDSAADAL